MCTHSCRLSRSVAVWIIRTITSLLLFKLTRTTFSANVKIIPMGDDEGGTCIVETPEEIIDASVSTQMTNIRDLLRDQMGAF